MASRSCISIVQAPAFVQAALRYRLRILPQARAELSACQRRAEQIPSGILRDVARQALLAKSDILEGALVFAAFAPRPALGEAVRAIAAFEIAFDYLDSVVELSISELALNGLSLCRVLESVLEPDLSSPNYQVHHSNHDDGGYLEALMDTCRAALGKLPSYAAIVEPARRVLSRIATYQSLSHREVNGSQDAFSDWARSQSAPKIDLRWWETGAALGSQLSILALIAAAADPTTQVEQAKAIESAYFPWIGALSTLLDSVVDQYADRRDGQRSLIDYYSSPQVAAERLRLIAVEARKAVLALPDAANHSMILAAMAAFFHTRPQAAVPEVRLATGAVLDTMGASATPALLFFKGRRAWHRLFPSDARQTGRDIAFTTTKN